MCRVTSDNTRQKDGGTLNSGDSNCDAAGRSSLAGSESTSTATSMDALILYGMSLLN